MNRPVFFSVCMMMVCFSCGSEQAADNAEQPAVESATAGAAAAHLLTQDFPFDPEDKNRIDGSYQSNRQITVPGNLTPQNKWIMFEGPVLENDKVAYRYYADSRHRFDIYGKTVSDIVMDTVSWNYHGIMNWGSDILKVGNSLGMGSPGIYYQDSVYTLSDCAEKRIEVVETGSDKAVLRTTFKGLIIGGQTFDLEQDWSLLAGNYWSQIELKIVGGSLPDDMKFTTGIVKHLPDITTGQANGYTYAYNWGQQSFHEEMMGMAVLAADKFGPRVLQDDLSHLLVFENAAQAVSYRFMAVWERDQSGTKTSEAFAQMVLGATGK